jgi:hypothetical protein
LEEVDLDDLNIGFKDIYYDIKILIKVLIFKYYLEFTALNNSLILDELIDLIKKSYELLRLEISKLSLKKLSYIGCFFIILKFFSLYI